MSTQKVYLVTRDDLTIGQQAVQSAHALAEFAVCCPGIFKSWHETSNTLVMLTANDERHLFSYVEKCKMKGIAVIEFYEPDLNNALTAIAIEPKGGSSVRWLPLLGDNENL